MNIPENPDADFARVESVDVQSRRATLSLLRSVGSFESEPNGNWNFVSPKLCDMLGVPGSSLLGREWISMIHPDDVQRTVAEYKQARDGGRSWHHRFRFRTFDGSDLFVQVDANPLPTDPDQRGICYLGVVTDVSAVQRATDIVEEARDALQTLLDVSTEGIIIHRNSRILAANQAAATMLGFARWEDLIGVDGMELIVPEDKDKIRAAATSPHEALNVASFIRREGAPIPMSVKGAPTIYAGAPARVVSIVPIDSPHTANIAEARFAAATLAFEERLTLPYNRIAWLERGATVIAANQAYADFVGVPRDNVIGMLISDFVPYELNVQAWEDYERKLRTGVRQPTFDCTYRRSDGSLHRARVHAVDYRDPITLELSSMSFVVPL